MAKKPKVSVAETKVEATVENGAASTPAKDDNTITASSETASAPLDEKLDVAEKVDAVTEDGTTKDDEGKQKNDTQEKTDDPTATNQSPTETVVASDDKPEDKDATAVTDNKENTSETATEEVKLEASTNGTEKDSTKEENAQKEESALPQPNVEDNLDKSVVNPIEGKVEESANTEKEPNGTEAEPKEDSSKAEEVVSPKDESGVVELGIL